MQPVDHEIKALPTVPVGARKTGPVDRRFVFFRSGCALRGIELTPAIVGVEPEIADEIVSRPAPGAAK